MSLQAVIFDVDGVLVRSMEKHHEAYAAAFAPHGVKLEQSEVFVNEGRGSRDVAVAISKSRGLGLTDAQLDLLAKEKQRVFASFGPMPMYAGAKELVARLKARGLRLALVTGTSQVNIQNHFGSWLANFEVTVTADDVKRTKPDPEPYLKAIERLRIRPDEAVVVENAPLGIQSAKGAGLRVIAITTTNPAAALREADAIVADIADVEANL